LKFLERLGKVLVVNAIAVDVGLDGMSDAILARAEQLVKNETTELSDRKSHIFNLQRKLKIMKDQLDSKVEQLNIAWFDMSFIPHASVYLIHALTQEIRGSNYIEGQLYHP